MKRTFTILLFFLAFTTFHLSAQKAQNEKTVFNEPFKERLQTPNSSEVPNQIENTEKKGIRVDMEISQKNDLQILKRQQKQYERRKTLKFSRNRVFNRPNQVKHNLIDRDKINNIRETFPENSLEKIERIESIQDSIIETRRKERLDEVKANYMQTKLVETDSCLDSDSLALVAIYNKMNGANWTRRDNWLSTSKPVKDWWGVTVENYRVTKIDFYISYNEQQNLSGTLADDIFKLTELYYLDLSRNSIEGSVPAQISNLSKLSYLNLASNNLSGSIPVEISNLSSLNYLDLSSNQLTGSLFPELGTLTNLTDLLLGFNDLTGTIPIELGNLNNLLYLKLYYNQLEGEIPFQLGNLSQLIELSLNYNNLTGTIPVELGNLNNLEILSLAGNQLTGKVPSELGALSNLYYLIIYNNQFTGAIPAQLNNLSNFEYLSIYNNSFNELPDLSSLNALRYSFIQGNCFDFEDLEIAGIDWSSLSNYDYAPQDTILELDTVSNGDQFTITVNTVGSNNQYIWLKEGVVFDTTFSKSITVSKPATYQCRVINSQFPDLTLNSESLFVGKLVNGVAEQDYNALRVLYDSTYGENWDNNSNWLTDVDVNNWYGIGIRNYRVVSINLESNNLEGSIPSDLGNLSELEYLYLSSNQLSGAIPSELGNLSNLIDLYLPLNQLSGEIPPELGGMESLEILYLAGNNLSGSVPESFNDLPNCWAILLEDNNLEELTNLENTGFNFNGLDYLWVEDNNFTFGDLENTGYTEGQLNSFSYSPQAYLPMDLDTSNNTVTLTVLAESLNNEYQWFRDGDSLQTATDSIFTYDASSSATYFCKITNSTYPELTLKTEPVGQNITNGINKNDYNALVDIYNQTDGDNWINNTNWLSDQPVNEWIGITAQGTRVTQLNLDHNNLTGDFPGATFELDSLKRLVYWDNNLTGTIPDRFDEIKKLEYIDVDQNQLTGNIPASFGMLDSVKTAWLARNEFSGASDYTGMQKLQEFYIYKNKLNFSDLNDIGILPGDIVQYGYSPQDTLPRPDTIMNGNQITLSVDLKTANNEYIWVRNGVPFDTTTSNSITISNDDPAIYSCKIINSSYSALTLNTKEIFSGKIINGVYEEDYNALVALFNSTEGVNWDEKENWLTDADVNTWHGVEVEKYRVTGLNIPYNNLSGTIPAEIGNLKKVYYFYLYGNHLSGPIPPELGNLENITSLAISLNQLTGQIPSELGNLNNLSWLNLRGNRLTGSVPAEINNLNNLSSLIIYDNRLDELPDLSGLALSNCTIENNLFVFEDLETAGIDWSSLNDYAYAPQKSIIPMSVDTSGSMVTLTVLAESSSNSYQWFMDGDSLLTETDSILTYDESSGSVYYCSITNSSYPELTLQTKAVGKNLQNGVSKEDYNSLVELYNSTDGDNWNDNTNWLTNEPVGSWFGVDVEGTRVTEIGLDENNLTGNLPVELFNLDSLKYLSFYINNLNGNIPNEIGNLKELTYLDFDENQLSGEIPPELCNLTKLINLFIGWNQLEGTVPASIGNLTNLISFEMDNNNLTGPLPKQISNLTNLEWFNLSMNQFDSLPDLSALTNLNTLWVYDNSLTFEDLDSASIDPGSISDFNYSPQKKLPIPDTVRNGDEVTLTINAKAENNQYFWFKNGTPFDTTTTNSLKIIPQDVATYMGKIKNSNYSDLTLGTKDVAIEESNYLVKFVVDDGAEPVEAATITINSTTLDTDANGKAEVKLPSGSYDYTIACEGFEEASGTLIVDESGLSETVTLSVCKYTASFTVTDGNEPIAAASISIDNNTLSTNESGKATIELEDGNYNYTASADGYDAVSGTITIAGSNINETITLNLSKYIASFNVTDGSDPVENATIIIENTTITTGADGSASIDLLNGSYDYSITAEGYNDATGSILIEGNDITENVTLSESTTGIYSNEKANIKVYPNPANKVVLIEANEVIKQVKLINMRGRCILSKEPMNTSIFLNIDRFNRGTYIIIITNEEENTFSNKLLIR